MYVPNPNSTLLLDFMYFKRIISSLLKICTAATRSFELFSNAFLSTGPKGFFYRSQSLFQPAQKIFTGPKFVFTGPKVYFNRPKIFLPAPNFFLTVPKFF
jgi:hypothetical protein